MDTTGMTLTLTRHAMHTAAVKGFTPDQIKDCFANPKKVYPSKSRPGQYRVVNKDICIVGAPVSETEFRGITMYVNGSNSPKE